MKPEKPYVPNVFPVKTFVTHQTVRVVVWVFEVKGRITSGCSRVVGGLSESRKSLVSCGPVKVQTLEPIQSSLSTCLCGCSGNGIRLCNLRVVVLPCKECMSLFLEVWREASKELEGSLAPGVC